MTQALLQNKRKPPCALQPHMLHQGLRHASRRRRRVSVRSINRGALMYRRFGALISAHPRGRVDIRRAKPLSLIYSIDFG